MAVEAPSPSPDGAQPGIETARADWWRRRGLAELAIVVVSLMILFGPALVDHARNASNPMWFNDDCRQQIWPYLRYHDPSLFRDDYIAQYYLSYLPTGYMAMYRAWSWIADPIVLSKILPYVLLPAVLVPIALTARRLGGSVAAWGALALCLSSSYFLFRLSGGLPRAFGFPLIAGTALALVTGRPVMLAVLVCLGAAFYPTAGLVSGLTLAAMLLVVPRDDRGHVRDWSLRRRCVVVGLTLLVSCVVLWPQMRGSAAYGPRVRPDQLPEYPEAGPGGRIDDKNVPPYLPFTTEAGDLTHRTLVGQGRPWPLITSWIRQDDGVRGGQITALLVAFGVIGLAGSVVLGVRDPAARRFMLLPLAAVVGHMAARELAPLLYMPGRYAYYTVPVITVVLIPVGACALARLLADRLERPWLQPAAGLAVCVACVLGLGSRGDPGAGLNVRVDADHEIYGFLASLPDDALLAGWPEGVMDNVPYVSRRRILLSRETHMVLHRDYLLETRGRMMALLEAYYATEPTPLLHLRDRYGVTHMVFDRRHLPSPPVYFEPYHDPIRAALEQVMQQGRLEALSQAPHATVYDDGQLVVLDLNRIQPAEVAGGS